VLNNNVSAATMGLPSNINVAMPPEDEFLPGFEVNHTKTTHQ